MTVVMWGKAAHPAQSAMQEAPILKSPIKTLSWSGPTETPGTREMMALFAFDSLEPGDHIVLAFDAAPRGFLAHFQAERKGQFDWTPVRQGPETWTFEVSRRKAERGELRTVNEALSWDHDRLDALEGAAFEARAQGRFTEAAVIYAAFAYGLRRHIRFEEEILFPEFEEKTGHAATAGPTMVMRTSTARFSIAWIAFRPRLPTPPLGSTRFVTPFTWCSGITTSRKRTSSTP